MSFTIKELRNCQLCEQNLAQCFVNQFGCKSLSNLLKLIWDRCKPRSEVLQK
jgi:hypothetical protein